MELMLPKLASHAARPTAAPGPAETWRLRGSRNSSGKKIECVADDRDVYGRIIAVCSVNGGQRQRDTRE